MTIEFIRGIISVFTVTCQWEENLIVVDTLIVEVDVKVKPTSSPRWLNVKIATRLASDFRAGTTD
jgi:hypothetical protein